MVRFHQAREKAKKAAKTEPEEEEEETIESLERAGKKIPAAKRRMLEAIAAKRAAEEAARKEAEEAQRRVRGHVSLTTLLTIFWLTYIRA